MPARRTNENCLRLQSRYTKLHIEPDPGAMWRALGCPGASPATRPFVLGSARSGGGGIMAFGVRSFLLACAVLLAATDAAAAQVETLVVTAEKRESFSNTPYSPGEGAAPPHVFLAKRADHVITRVSVTCDTRDASQRRAELKETLRAMLRAASGTGSISLSVGDTVITDLTESDFDGLIVPDAREDTSQATVIVKTKITANDTLNAAMARILQFIDTTPKSGRTEMIRTGGWDLTIVGPEQYRDAIIALIVADAKHTAELFGPGNGVHVDGLEHRVSWYQKGPLDLALYIPYTMKLSPNAH